MKEKNYYVIGLDGGGSKIVAALADLRGKIIKKTRTGSASPRNVGFEKAVFNIATAIERVLPKNKKIISTFLGLPCLEEEFKNKKEKIKKALFRYKKSFPIFKEKLIIGSDQLVGFRSGTNSKEGIVVIAGSGSVVHGWSKEKEVKISGWGYLTEEGAAYWTGKEAILAVFRDLDEIGEKTLITQLAFKKFKTAKKEKLIEKIYSKNQREIILSFSVLTDEAAKRGDKVAQRILKEGGRKLVKATRIAIKKLNFQNKEFPLILIGGMFKSKIFLETVKKEIKKFAPQVKIIKPKKEPVVGAIRLAIEETKNAV